MDSNVLVALISLVGIIISGIISAIVSNKLIEHRLESLEKKVDEHNGYAKMFAQEHEAIALIQKDISYLKENAK